MPNNQHTSGGGVVMLLGAALTGLFLSLSQCPKSSAEEKAGIVRDIGTTSNASKPLTFNP